MEPEKEGPWAGSQEAILVPFPDSIRFSALGLIPGR